MLNRFVFALKNKFYRWQINGTDRPWLIFYIYSLGRKFFTIHLILFVYFCLCSVFCNFVFDKHNSTVFQYLLIKFFICKIIDSKLRMIRPNRENLIQPQNYKKPIDPFRKVDYISVFTLNAIIAITPSVRRCHRKSKRINFPFICLLRYF